VSPYWGETMVNFGREEPKEWTCECGHENRRYMARCWECSEPRPAWSRGRSRPGLLNLASHNEADGRI